MGEWSHCTECGETAGPFDFHGVCFPCKKWFAEQEKKWEAERAEDLYWREIEAREAKMFNELDAPHFGLLEF